MNIRKLFQQTKERTESFKKIDADVIGKYPAILKIFRLSLNLSVADFSKKFEMHQQSRFERGFTKPSKETINRFLKIFSRYKSKCNFDFEKIKSSEKMFMKKHFGGRFVGGRTLFKTNDERTKQLSIKGAQSGGLKTVEKYGRSHMALLAKKIKRGRKENSGFRSKAEFLVAQALRKIGTEFEYEVPVDGYLPDFKIGNTLIEVMCENTPIYWSKQHQKLSKLSKNYKIIVLTNKPEKISDFSNVLVLKFSKYPNVLESCIREVL